MLVAREVGKGVDIDFTSVNVSGPPALVQQRPGWRIDDLVLIEEP